jgi:phytoene synthase
MQDPFDHCAQVVRETDKDRFLATLFAPANRRGPLFALYAFNSEIARVREAIRDPMAGEVRLQWWRDAVERPGSGEAKANPIASALLDTVIRFQLPVQSLMSVIEAREFDLYRDPMPALAALEAYADRTSATLLDLAATILEVRHPDVSTAVHHGGLAYAMTGLLRAFPLHAARGQLYVPLEIIDRHGVKPEDVFAGRASTEISAVLAEMRRIAQSHLDGFAQVSGTIPPIVAPAFLPLALVPLYLKRLERFGDQPFHLVDVSQWRRQWTLWRTARRIPST